MIDAVLKLLEKLTQLAKHKKEVEEKTFDLLIKPLYTDLETIHLDYLKMFEKYQRELEEGTELEKIAWQLEFDRLDLEPLRSSIRPFVESYEDNPKLNAYIKFFSSVVKYLHCVPGRESWSSSLISILNEINNSSLSDQEIESFREEVSKFLLLTLKWLRKNWAKISTEYAKLLAKVATS
ncbi:hypothetical protein ACFLRB_04315 [Acidobacteriota bacterium]